LFLDGVPEIARYDVIRVGPTPKEQIENNMALEIKGVAAYNNGIQLCIEAKDSGSRELMERMVVESEDSIDWAEAQLDLIKMTGLENYLAQKIGDPPAQG
jgi:bacterioferritin